jgi:hypothetical protein
VSTSLYKAGVMHEKADAAEAEGAAELGAIFRDAAYGFEAQDVSETTARRGYPAGPVGYHDTSGAGTTDDAGDSWAPVDLCPVVSGEVVPLAPTILVCEDGCGLFYPGRVNGVHGDSGIGKSWLADLATAQEIGAGRHVIVIDLEDDAHTMVSRLRDLGVAPERIVEFLHYHRPTEPFDVTAVDTIEAEAREFVVTLIVIDSVGEAFGLEGINEDKDAEVGPWLRRVARRLADTGACVLLVDHGTKAADNPLHPSGSKRKRAVITGASYLVEAPRPLTREDGGRLRLLTAKDRHGHRRRGAEACSVEFTKYPDGGMTVHIWPPSLATRNEDTPDGKLLVVARSAVRAARDVGRPLSQRELLERMSVKARAETKKAAIEMAVALGALRTEDGPRRSVLHVYVCDLTDDQDPEI